MFSSQTTKIIPADEYAAFFKLSALKEVPKYNIIIIIYLYKRVLKGNKTVPM